MIILECRPNRRYQSSTWIWCHGFTSFPRVYKKWRLISIKASLLNTIVRKKCRWSRKYTRNVLILRIWSLRTKLWRLKINLLTNWWQRLDILVFFLSLPDFWERVISMFRKGKEWGWWRESWLRLWWILICCYRRMDWDRYLFLILFMGRWITIGEGLFGCRLTTWFCVLVKDFIGRTMRWDRYTMLCDSV